MAPNAIDNILHFFFAEIADKVLPNKKNCEVVEKKKYKWDIVWRNVIGFAYLYLCALYGFYTLFFVVSWKTFFWVFYMAVISGFGTTVGAHRLWTHRTYKANLPLQILLMYFQTSCFQNSIYVWARDHRLHHKYTDTDADPHNATRGFFFSHIGWLLLRKHEDVKIKGKTIWMKDLKEDAVVMFQKKYYFLLMPLLCFIIPAVIPWYFWNEPFMNSWSVNIARYVGVLNGTWSVNSAAHLYGMRPYDKNIMPRENLAVSLITGGEGWHNYHHVYPWDYKAGEFGSYRTNLATGFIDLMAKIGWAYDLKAVDPEVIQKRILKTGDGTNLPANKSDKEDNLWGWEDENMTQENIQATTRKFIKD